jgi:multimeric flavodoxin WrbA
MKILLLNGSPHPKGCTFTALKEIATTLQELGAQSEIFNTGTLVESCRACGWCKKNAPESISCVIDDKVNEFAELAKKADGFIFGSPVHYAAPSGAISAFLGRLFMSQGSVLAGKPGAAVVSCRRAGSSAALDSLNKFFTINQMPLVSSTYWNMVHGAKAEQVLEDKEGLHTMRTLARNLYDFVSKTSETRQELLDSNEASEPKEWTNFIR